MRYSNLHNHTTFSDGKNTVRENVEHALLLGMESIGFSDHSFTACDTSYCMKEEQYPAYMAEVKAIKEEYRDRIPVYLGIEKDYCSDIVKEDFDYVIGSVHYIIENGVTYPIDHSRIQQQECIRDAFGGDVFAMAERYYCQLVEQARTVRPTFIGHFDVLNKFSIMPEDDPRYIKLTMDKLEECVRYCPYLEVNTGGISRGWRTFPYPSPYLLNHLRELGGHVLLGADSHAVSNLTFFFDEAVKVIREAGFKTLSVFRAGRFEEIEL